MENINRAKEAYENGYAKGYMHGAVVSVFFMLVIRILQIVLEAKL